MANVTINSVKGVYIEASSPDTRFTQQPFKTRAYKTVAGAEFVDKMSCFVLDKSPLSGKRVLKAKSVSFTPTNKSLIGNSITDAELYFATFKTELNIDTVSWNNKPATTSGELPFSLLFSQVSLGVENTITNLYPYANDAEVAYKLLINGVRTSAYLISGSSSTDQSANIEMNSSLLMNFEYEVVAINPGNLYPISGFIDKRSPVTFGWDLSYDPTNVIGTVNCKGAKFRWRPVGTTPYTEIAATGKSITIPANTFSGNIEWQVVVISDDNVESSPSAWMQLTTTDSISTATALSPANTYIDNQQGNTFAWQHINATGMAATKSELQYSTDNGTTWLPLAMVNGSITSTAIPANTLPDGRIYWRVRTYNADGVAGAWSVGVAVSVFGAAPLPVIGQIVGTARLTVHWQATGQIAYQVQLSDAANMIYDTGEQAGEARSRFINLYLAHGSYSIKLRIKGTTGAWSSWVSANHTVATASLQQPMVSVAPGIGCINITVSNSQQYSKLYLYRDGAAIANITNAYSDYGALGAHSYFVRGVDSNDNFADSEPVAAECILALGAVIAPVSNLSAGITLLISRDKPKHKGRITPIGEARYYAGRQYPVYEISEFVEESYTASYSVRTMAEWQQIKAIIYGRKTILYRDTHGNRYYGFITATGFEQDSVSIDFELSISRVDFVEEITLDIPEVV